MVTFGEIELETSSIIRENGRYVLVWQMLNGIELETSSIPQTLVSFGEIELEISSIIRKNGGYELVWQILNGIELETSSIPQTLVTFGEIELEISSIIRGNGGYELIRRRLSLSRNLLTQASSNTFKKSRTGIANLFGFFNNMGEVLYKAMENINPK
ncbi:hypothetical protein FHS15_000001 [Paenibacillus castaneae]|uniref:hypothetical protein n=1 Tax=Paenibacillus castaneae TaxID=474957 RepID=UPI0011AF5C4F|nr:hypothetical protein [Paenibacillus castaneae]NIK74903.1 hypothetical protein [Paenibacillus castaneae]